METYTKQDVIGILQTAIGEGNSAAAFAHRHDASPQYISDVLNGRRDPGPKLLEILGLERITVYRKKARRKKEGEKS